MSCVQPIHPLAQTFVQASVFDELEVRMGRHLLNLPVIHLPH